MNINEEEKQRIKSSIKKMVDNGSTVEHAISVISSENNISPSLLMKTLYPSYDKNEKDSEKKYNDIKTSEGTYVILKKNPNTRYEVINIKNKEEIILRNLLTNKTIKAREEDILPIVTENNMRKNLKEANYNLSIDGLETIDAEKLSQILSLAGEAEGNVTDTTFEPEVDMSDADLNAYANPEYDTAVVPTDSLNDMDNMDTTFDADMSFEQEPTLDDKFGYEEYNQYPVTESKMDEDVLLDPKSDDETYNAQKKDIEAAELLGEEISEDNDVESFMSDYFYDNAELQSEYDDESLDEHKNEIYAKWKEMVKDGEDELVAAEMAANEVLQKSDDKDISDNTEELTVDEPIEENEDMDIDISELDVDDEIAECLRLAGVELNEVSEEKATKGKKDLPQVVGKKTSFVNAKHDDTNPGENQRPKYRCVRTKDVMGKESSEGFKEPLNVAKVCCNESKIKSIYETAKRMYAKKDTSEWLALDKRYTEKLLNEGIGYEKASKMLLKAKTGK